MVSQAIVAQPACRSNVAKLVSAAGGATPVEDEVHDDFDELALFFVIGGTRCGARLGDGFGEAGQILTPDKVTAG